jgi:hypothetical protein
VFGLELGYLEFRFHFLQASWDHYLLLSSLVYFALAYRFDNRFVLSLALSTMAAWFGLRFGVHLSLFGPVFGPDSLRPYALAYGGLVAIAGVGLHRAGIKSHFLEAYLHVAANVLFIAVLSRVFDGGHEWLYLAGLLALAGIAITQGVRFKRFAFVVYGVVYGYIGISERLMQGTDNFTSIMAAALAGIYVTLNLQLTFDVFSRARGLNSGAFYWLTYTVTWVLPIVGLHLGIREKDRMLMNASGAIALVTLLTNKMYLGWERHAWDPILLGVFLMAVAIGVRRWLSEGPGGERNGFTPEPLLGKDSAVLTLLRTASARFQPDVDLSGSRVPTDGAAKPPDFGGGRSGGGGGGGTY